jgi:uncharacterized protein
MMNEAHPDYGLLDRAGAAATAFYPRPDHVPPPAGAVDLTIGVAPGVKLGARFYAGGPTEPNILYFHGNGEVASDHDDFAPFYRQIGVNLLVVEFRGYGTSSGTPSFAALVADARVVAGWFQTFLDEQGFSGARFVMGRSLGAHPALEIAARFPTRFAGLILESGAGNVRGFASRFGLDEQTAKDLVAAHERKVGSIGLPVLMIHGQRDELVPLSSAVETYELMSASERELVIVANAGHNDILWVGKRQYFAAIEAFVTRHSN